MATDRRVKYTKMVLKQSLIKILEDRPISRITIKELCEDADINRATFYTHFTDQYDLLKKIQEEFIADINSYLDSFALEKGETDLVQMLTRILEYIAQNKELCRVLLGKNGDMDFQSKVISIVSKRIVIEWQKRKKLDNSTVEYIFTYVATGSVGIILKWLFDESPRSPHEMAKLITILTNKGIEIYIK